jgi:hypothetical protein
MGKGIEWNILIEDDKQIFEEGSEEFVERGPADWYKPITATEVTPFFYSYLTSEEYRNHIDFSGKSHKQMWEYDEKKVASLIAKMPMSKWSGSSKGLISFENGIFDVQLEIPDPLEKVVYEFTREICEFRLHAYFQRRTESVKWR